MPSSRPQLSGRSVPRSRRGRRDVMLSGSLHLAPTACSVELRRERYLRGPLRFVLSLKTSGMCQSWVGWPDPRVPHQGLLATWPMRCRRCCSGSQRWLRGLPSTRASRVRRSVWLALWRTSGQSSMSNRALCRALPYCRGLGLCLLPFEGCCRT